MNVRVNAFQPPHVGIRTIKQGSQRIIAILHLDFITFSLSLLKIRGDLCHGSAVQLRWADCALRCCVGTLDSMSSLLPQAPYQKQRHRHWLRYGIPISWKHPSKHSGIINVMIKAALKPLSSSELLSHESISSSREKKKFVIFRSSPGFWDGSVILWEPSAGHNLKNLHSSTNS